MSLIKQCSIKYMSVAALLCCGVLSGPAMAADVTWRAVSHQLPGTSRFEDTVVPFANCVSESSDGRMEIQVFGGGVLFPVSQSLKSIRIGIVEMAMIWSGYWAGVDPVFALVGSRPGDPIKTFSENLYRAKQLHDVVAKAYEQVGVKSLGAFDFGPPEILMSTVAVSSLSDFKGKKIRTAGIGAEFYKRLGASPVTLNGTAIYQALQLGTVDMAEYNDWLVNKEMGFDEVTEYVIEPMLHTGAIMDKELIVNPAAWGGLDDDLKQIVLTCRDKAMLLSATAYGIGNQKARQAWVNDGVETIELPEADVRKARKIAAQVMLDYADKSSSAQKYLSEYAHVLEELGYTAMAKSLGVK